MDVKPEDLQKDFDGAMRTLEAAVGSDEPREHAAVLNVLYDVTLRDVHDPARTVRLLERCLLERPDDEDDTPSCLEFWLNRSAATPELRPRMEALAMRQIWRGSGGEWASISHVIGMAADDPDLGYGREDDQALRDMRERLL